jgi:hypothetical protein
MEDYHLSMEGPTDHLVTVGSLAINNTRLVGFDLPKTGRVDNRAHLEIQIIGWTDRAGAAQFTDGRGC